MQKCLTQMNLQLANVITDIMGQTGQKILRAILAGERDVEKMADMRDYRIQASREEIVASLTGNWRPELLFALKQEIERYDFCHRRLQNAIGKSNRISRRCHRGPKRPPRQALQTQSHPGKRRKHKAIRPLLHLTQ